MPYSRFILMKDPDDQDYSQWLDCNLQSLLPNHLQGLESIDEFQVQFSEYVPKFKVIFPTDSHRSIKVLLLTRNKSGLLKFFHEMVSRWLVPGRALHLKSFMNLNFNIEHGSESYSLLEARLEKCSLIDIEKIKRHLPFFTQEIEFGATSYYQAMQILEMKGMLLSEKAIAVQEGIAYLAQRFPAQIDADIYFVMRLVMMSCQDSFKQIRAQKHLVKMVKIFYRFYSRLKKQNRTERYIDTHLFSFDLEMPFEVVKRTAVCFALNSLGNHEVFELNQLLLSLPDFISHSIDPQSCFQFEMKECQGKFFYFEMPHQPLLVLSQLRKELIFKVNHSIQTLVRPLFMPRNEEEIMKSMVSLSRQMRYIRDIPQVIINFERQSESALIFRVLLIRLLHKGAMPFDQIKQAFEEKYQVHLERCRLAGMVRKKTPKEASIFTLTLNPSEFLRFDHTLDLYKARYEVYRALKSVLGEVRDFNGGLLAKQRERLEEIKKKLHVDQKALFENFFFSLYPVEYRMVWSPEDILQFFTSYLKWIEKGELSQDVAFEWASREKEADAICQKFNDLIQSPTQLIRLKMLMGDRRLIGHAILP
ncbi:MAG: hypothetical protein K9M13_00230 [Simkaniaceae bacterium]|nr:hypothetical protein [Simkaniaceae bacterium]